MACCHRALHGQVGLDIVRAEGSAMWTLMHRYNKAASILDGLVAGQYGPDLDVASAAAHVFVWLRFSANRQLTWQRNYNTQPRVLSEAQASALSFLRTAMEGRRGPDRRLRGAKVLRA